MTVRRRKMRMNSSKHLTRKKETCQEWFSVKAGKLLEWEKSKRALAKYQLDQGDVSDEVVKRW